MSDNTPITGELREYATVSWNPWPEARDRLYQMCDAIDAIHANLERENESLRRELDRVMGEQDEGPTIGTATVTITPTLDWTGVARELRAITDALALMRWRASRWACA